MGTLRCNQCTVVQTDCSGNEGPAEALLLILGVYKSVTEGAV